jgi:hypothetical protein
MDLSSKAGRVLILACVASRSDEMGATFWALALARSTDFPENAGNLAGLPGGPWKI